MANVTQTEWLVEWWQEALKPDVRKYDLIDLASKLRGKEDKMPRERLKYLREQFITDHVRRKKYPMAKQCFLCSDDGTKNFLVRHHIISLSKYGANRRLNIVTLCARCHAYFHPWLFKDNDPYFKIVR